MSHDLVFWRQAAGTATDPKKIGADVIEVLLRFGDALSACHARRESA